MQTTSPRFSGKIAVLIGLCIVGLGLFIIFGRGGLTKASDERPIDVTVTPNSPNSVTVNWSTGNPTQGQVLFSTDIDGADKNKTPSVLPEVNVATSHSVILPSLDAGKTYYFKIQIGESVYDNGGVAWSFTTPSSDAVITPSASILAPTGTASGAVQPTKSATKVTPIQHLVIGGGNSGSNPTVAPTQPAAGSCNYTDCTVIKSKFGQGCSTQDYIKCLRRQ
jgi:hypothetical protein